MSVMTSIAVGLSATLLYDFCTQVRRFFRIAYVPVYFQFLPLEVLNRDLSTYVGDDLWLGADDASKFTSEDFARLKARILRRGILAVAVSVIAIPSMAAFLVAHYMAREHLLIALLGILALQGESAWLTVQGFSSHASVADKRTLRMLSLLLAVYSIVVVWVFRAAYLWTRVYVESGRYSALWVDLTDFVVGKIIVSGVVVAVFAAVFLKDLTDRHVPQLDRPAEDASKPPH